MTKKHEISLVSRPAAHRLYLCAQRRRRIGCVSIAAAAEAPAAGSRCRGLQCMHACGLHMHDLARHAINSRAATQASRRVWLAPACCCCDAMHARRAAPATRACDACVRGCIADDAWWTKKLDGWLLATRLHQLCRGKLFKQCWCSSWLWQRQQRHSMFQNLVQWVMVRLLTASLCGEHLLHAVLQAAALCALRSQPPISDGSIQYYK